MGRANKHPENYDKENYENNKIKKNIRKGKYSKTIEGRFVRGKCEAKKKNIPWLLSKDFYEKLVEPDKCFYNCGSQLNKGGYSLDRIDNSKGYSEDNVLPCCWNCNSLRRNKLSVEETIKIIQLLKDLRKTEAIWE